MGSSYGLLAHGAASFGPEAFAPDAIASGAVVRAAGVLFDAAPYLFVGALVAAVMRGMIGREPLRGAFSGRWGSLRAAALGLALPLCALSVLPAARELRRAGVAVGPTVAFIISAAMLNPLSFTYGLTLFDPALLGAVVLAATAVSVVVGATLARVTTPVPDETGTEVEVVPNTGGRRLALTALAFTQAWLGAPAVCLVIGVAGAGGVAGVLPPGLLASSMTRGNTWAPAVMALVAAPSYATPLAGMMQAGTLVRDGFSPGAAWASLALGAGVGLGGVAWVGWAYGRGVCARFVCTVVGVTLLLGYAAHFLVPSPVAAPDHTHCLDEYTRPPAVTVAPLRARLTGADALPLAALAASGLLGVLLRKGGVKVGPGPAPDTEETSGRARWNPTISSRWLTGIGVAGGALLAAQLLYVLYPPPSELFEEVTAGRIELAGPMRPADRDSNLEHVRRLQELVRKLPVAAAIRQGRLTPGQRERTDELADGLNALHESVEAGRQAEAVALLRYVKDASDACRAAYQIPSTDTP